jgi:hypothetical protein
MSSEVSFSIFLQVPIQKQRIQKYLAQLISEREERSSRTLELQQEQLEKIASEPLSLITDHLKKQHNSYLVDLDGQIETFRKLIKELEAVENLSPEDVALLRRILKYRNEMPTQFLARIVAHRQVLLTTSRAIFEKNTFTEAQQRLLLSGMFSLYQPNASDLKLFLAPTK